jgi:hypothetical protein
MSHLKVLCILQALGNVMLLPSVGERTGLGVLPEMGRLLESV